MQIASFYLFFLLETIDFVKNMEMSQIVGGEGSHIAIQHENRYMIHPSVV